jgi:cobaltochelatase CobS
MKAIQVCTNRFDEDTKNSFLDLYTKVDAGEDLSQLNQTEEPVSNDSEENEQY